MMPFVTAADAELDVDGRTSERDRKTNNLDRMDWSSCHMLADV